MKKLLSILAFSFFYFQSFAQTSDTTFSSLKNAFEVVMSTGDTAAITDFYKKIDPKTLTKNEYYFFHFMYSNFMGTAKPENSNSKGDFGLDYGFKEIDTSAKYCLIMGTQKWLSKKVVIDVDFGQEQYLFKNSTRLLDQTGRAVTFNSVIDVLNYMNKNGWEFVDAYAITVRKTNVYHYLMRKRD